MTKLSCLIILSRYSQMLYKCPKSTYIEIISWNLVLVLHTKTLEVKILSKWNFHIKRASNWHRKRFYYITCCQYQLTFLTRYYKYHRMFFLTLMNMFTLFYVALHCVGSTQWSWQWTGCLRFRLIWRRLATQLLTRLVAAKCLKMKTENVVAF